MRVLLHEYLHCNILMLDNITSFRPWATATHATMLGKSYRKSVLPVTDCKGERLHECVCLLFLHAITSKRIWLKFRTEINNRYPCVYFGKIYNRYPRSWSKTEFHAIADLCLLYTYGPEWEWDIFSIDRLSILSNF